MLACRPALTVPIRANIDIDRPALLSVADTFEQRERRVRDMRPALTTMVRDFEALEDRAFRTQGRSIGAPWKPVSEMWRRYKARRGLSSRILEMAPAGQFGRLRAALTITGAPYSVRRMGSHDMVAGTNFGIARIHQTGGTTRIRGRVVTIPRRRFVSLRRADRQRWTSYAGEYIFHGSTRTRRLGP